MTVKRQQHFDQPKRDELSARRLKELIQLNEDVKKVITEDANLPGRQSGMYIVLYMNMKTEHIKRSSDMADKSRRNFFDYWELYGWSRTK